MGRTARAGREGQPCHPQDVALLKSIEAHTGATMGELEMDDARVAEILVQVNTARRESDIKLEGRRTGVRQGRPTRGRNCRGEKEAKVEEKEETGCPEK